MKNKFLSVISIAVSMLLICVVFFAGCFFNRDTGDATMNRYMIQYTDDEGTHQITVYDGMSYTLTDIPTKHGYTFLGLYDSQVGGIQYISSSGSSIAPFTDKKNLVLYPQFKAKDYTVVLDYQGAAVTGSRQLTVSYNSSITDLPKNLIIEHKNFAGWFTEKNCEGTQVADKYGSIPIVSILNDNNFDLSGASITLYAGFEIEKHTVTFCFEDGVETEEIYVEYNTPISQVISKTRKNGFAPLTWSKTQGGSVWNGKVTNDMTLYVVEYAPVIELNDGTSVKEIVARAGDVVLLPAPQNALSEFMYWINEDGKKITQITMPEKCIKLSAVWRNSIVFNSNGGSEVDIISGMAGDSITLPKPTRDGYTFAGWYTDNEVKYNNTFMPDESICLTAGWYKDTSYKVTVVGSSSYQLTARNTPNKLYAFDLYEQLGINFQETPENVQLQLSFQSEHNRVGAGYIFNPNKTVTAGITCYVMSSENQNSSSTYYQHSFGSNAIIDSYQGRELKTEFNLSSRYLYILFTAYKESDSTDLANPSVYIKNAVLTISYPDTSKLYL